MGYCSKCGGRVETDWTHCPKCGRRLVHEPPPKRPGNRVQRGGTTISEESPWPVEQTSWPGRELGLPAQGSNSLADPGQRFAARLIDLLIGVAIFLACFLPWFLLDIATKEPWEDTGALTGLGSVLGVITWIAYFPFMHATRGQTIGKRAMRIRLASIASGEPPSWGSAILREVLGFIPYLGLLVYAWLLWDRNRQGLHDKAAQTVVVRTE